ncbi:tumor necrosis factor receptor superfamily member 6B isoform X1 [Falco biarmicus]|uniref:tumor necrosis factor receptor superfamily member 6B isoform X1 n=2 Tax=Falco peregrinus TaxID=8954 RepID=UPI000FFB5D1A|nr:tumor necrosis factor receptor superfamily member 6B isoform X1 [Falco peregrinus]XP_027669456.1 tumor necrosis factor receptor superfamily member 6B isoform X1 [Falco cherrug]XP_037257978.1 tumor necrosis factor receptor superfamily member 6B isoform X1 [Falco rusticolus]XP_056209837.1 tumor necrosis factor receptor superfamily member 6B isoform X1 [Falco biarmicus]
MLPCHVPDSRHPSKWMFAPLLFFLAELGCSAQPTYQWKDAVTNEKLTCQQCPPGTFVAQHCTRDRQTVCKPCPDLHYTQYWNYLEKCRYCNVICEEKQVEVQQCNSTHNRVCQCQEGYYSELEFCIRHSECPPGSGVEKLGTPFEDTQCRACPRGFFSSSNSSTKPCQPHQDCEQQGKVTNVQGNQYHDTLCTSCAPWRRNSTQEPGDDECEQAMIDFVAYQNIPPRKLKRLQQILERSPKKQALGSKAASQEKFRAFLTNLKGDHYEVSRQLLVALRATKLHSIEEKVRQRFLLQ